MTKYRKKYQNWKYQRTMKKIEKAGVNAQYVYSYLCEPSQREIAAALGMPKSTVNDAIQRLKKSGIKTGAWTV